MGTQGATEGAADPDDRARVGVDDEGPGADAAPESPTSDRGATTVRESLVVELPIVVLVVAAADVSIDGALLDYLPLTGGIAVVPDLAPTDGTGTPTAGAATGPTAPSAVRRRTVGEVADSRLDGSSLAVDGRGTPSQDDDHSPRIQANSQSSMNTVTPPSWTW